MINLWGASARQCSSAWCKIKQDSHHLDLVGWGAKHRSHRRCWHPRSGFLPIANGCHHGLFPLLLMIPLPCLFSNLFYASLLDGLLLLLLLLFLLLLLVLSSLLLSLSFSAEDDNVVIRRGSILSLPYKYPPPIISLLLLSLSRCCCCCCCCCC